MEILSIRFVGDSQTRHLITECNESDTCPGCGAGYMVGFTECEYCRTAIQWAADGSGQALLFIEGDGYALDAAPALTAEQVIIKLLRQLRTKAPHYREDVEAIEAGRAWLDGRA